MSTWFAILWSLPLPVFVLLHLWEYLRRRDNPGLGAERPAVYYNQTGMRPLIPFHDERGIHDQSVMQGVEHERLFSTSHRVSSETLGLAGLLVRLLVVPLRLILWAWWARTWRPLALLAGLVLGVASLFAWFYGYASGPGAGDQANTVAWDAGFVAALEVPVLIVIGAWPWWQWRGLVAAAISAAMLIAWLIYAVPARI